jgi:large subunit ribosomal protein L23
MALTDLFKKKKQEPKTVKKEEKKEEPKKEEKKEAQVPKKQRKITGESLKILKSPHVAEKATDLLDKNQYVFKVWPKANKQEVKKAVESIFNVRVLGVRMVNLPAKKRRIGRFLGSTQTIRKAIIKVAAGEKIEILPR